MIRTERRLSLPCYHGGYDAERTGAGPDGAGARDRPLDALRGTRSADRFRVWTGRSGRRYVFSVFPLDGRECDPDRSLLTRESVVIAVARGADGGRTRLWVDVGGPSAADVVADLRGRALDRGGACELHLHFLASDDDERLAIVGDLESC